jgi:hypothetical protein
MMVIINQNSKGIHTYKYILITLGGVIKIILIENYSLVVLPINMQTTSTPG